MKEELKILFVEDLDDDAFIVRKALEKGELKHKLYRVKDGKEALDFIFNKGRYTDKEEYPLPDVVLLDLRLPKIDGLEVLDRIRKDEASKELPVIVLTDSKRDEDILKSYEGGISGYITKSAYIRKDPTLDGLVNLVVSMAL